MVYIVSALGAAAPLIIHRRVGPHLDELAHGRVRVIGHAHIGLLPARHVHRDQRIAIEVSLPDDFLFRTAGKERYERWQ